MGVKEGLAVKFLNVQDGGTFQTAAQSLLRAAFVSDEGLQHSPHHVELYIYLHEIYILIYLYISEISLPYLIMTDNLILLQMGGLCKGSRLCVTQYYLIKNNSH